MMTKRLAPYGPGQEAAAFSMVGGKGKTPQRLSDRMPSPEIAAKVGNEGISAVRTHRVIRRNARG